MDFPFDSGIADGTTMPVTARVQRCVAIPMPVFRLQERGGGANTVKCEALTRGSCPDQCSQAIQRVESVGGKFCAM